MPREDVLNRLREIAHRLNTLDPKKNAEIAIVNLMTGAVYALYQAAELDYDDTRANPNPDISKQEFNRTISNISKGKSPDRAWLSGFYLNSALLRISPLNERINKHTYTKHYIPKVHDLVNKIKHESDAQIGGVWDVTLVDAVDTLEVLYKRLEDSLHEE